LISSTHRERRAFGGGKLASLTQQGIGGRLDSVKMTPRKQQQTRKIIAGNARVRSESAA
jgi:hypothetical protein